MEAMADFGKDRKQGEVVRVNKRTVVMRMRYKMERLRSLGIMMGLFGRKMSMGKGYETVSGVKFVKRHRWKHRVEPLDFSFWPKEDNHVV